MREQNLKAPAHDAGFLFLGNRPTPAPVIRFISMSCLVLAAAMILGACTTSTTPEPAETQEAAPTEPLAEEATAPATGEESNLYPQTHSDVLGRSVIFESRPEAIVSLAPSVTEMLFAIGAGGQVIGRTDFDNYPTEVETLPSIGGFTVSTISIESILALEPDLVVGGAAAQAEIVDALDGTGIEVFILEANSIDEIKNEILTLGEITDNREGAQAVVVDMENRVAAVTEKVNAVQDGGKVTVFYEIWHEPLTTATNETVTGDLIATAGGTNIFGDLEGEYPTVSAEEILESDPDIILGPSTHTDQLTSEIIAGRPGWEDLNAVQSEAIYIVDGDIVSRPGPRVVDALETIAAYLYPELFGE